MSVRLRVAIALVVAALVPLLGAYAVAGILIPRSLGAAEGDRLAQEATATSAVLARECAGVGDLARLVVAQLQVAGSVVGTDVQLAAAVADAASEVVATATANRSGTVVFVLAADGSTLVADGDDAREDELDPGSYVGGSCSSGTATAVSPALVEQLPVTIGAEEVATVLAVRPVDDVALTGLRATLGLQASELAVVDPASETPAVGLTTGLSTDPDLRGDFIAGVVAEDGAGGRGDLAGRRYSVGPEIAQTGYRAVAVGPREVSIGWVLVVALVVSLLAVALLVQLLAASLTRPLTELGDLARRIAGGDAPADTGDRPAPLSESDADVKGVGLVLERLARDLRATEADVERGRDDFVDAFGRFGRTIEQSHDLPGLIDSLLTASLLAGGASRAVILHDENGRVSQRRVVGAQATASGTEELESDVLAALREVGERALAERASIQEDGVDGLGPILAMPLQHEDRYLGAAVVAREPGAAQFDAVNLDALANLLGPSGTAIYNEQLYREAERLSVTDPLTGLGNFRQLTSMLSREVERAARFGHPLGVLMVDVDHFKRVNDTYGHGPGDAVLREMARRLRECVREVDTVARYGGEEFALLLPETDLDGTVRLAERVVASFRSDAFRLPGGTEIQVTGSVGVSSYPQHGLTGNELMRAADAAMYAAKTAGRDRVAVAPGGSTTARATKGPRTT